ncbi:hypothetical protein FF2_046474 [Malus domestica]
MPITSRIRAKHLKLWMRICAIVVVQKTIGPLFADRAPKKVVNEYHSHRKKFESNFMQVDELETTKMEISDFQEDTTPMED